MRCRASLRHAQGPLDGFEVHRADVGIVPRLLSMTERGVENAAFAIHFAPGHGKVMVSAMNSRIVVIIEL